MKKQSKQQSNLLMPGKKDAKQNLAAGLAGMVRRASQASAVHLGSDMGDNSSAYGGSVGGGGRKKAGRAILKATKNDMSGADSDRTLDEGVNNINIGVTGLDAGGI